MSYWQASKLRLYSRPFARSKRLFSSSTNKDQNDQLWQVIRTEQQQIRQRLMDEPYKKSNGKWMTFGAVAFIVYSIFSNDD